MWACVHHDAVRGRVLADVGERFGDGTSQRLDGRLAETTWDVIEEQLRGEVEAVGEVVTAGPQRIAQVGLRVISGPGEEAAEVTVGVTGEAGQDGVSNLALEDGQGLQDSVVQRPSDLVSSPDRCDLVLGATLKSGQVAGAQPGHDVQGQ